MQQKWAGCFGIVLLAVSAAYADAGKDTIDAARYASPTERYGHFALGRPHEYAVLEASTANGKRLRLQLPDDEVFEDLAPRLVKLSADAPTTLLTIVSERHRGARLVLIEQSGNQLRIAAQSDPIGTPHRWLNPVGVADLDGDGRAEIAAVITPHIAGSLKIYQRQGHRLVEKASRAGLSNHIYGSTQLGLSMPVPVAGNMLLLVPDQQRDSLRLIAFRNGQLSEAGRCMLATKITGTITRLPPDKVMAITAAGTETIELSRCIQSD